MANTWNQSGTTWGQNSYGLQTEVNISVTGLSLTSTVGSVESFNAQGWGRDTWGFENWGESAIDVILSGLTATTSLNIPNEFIEVQPGWGTLDWGENGWGSVEEGIEVLTGQQATSAVGSIAPADAIGLTGQGATSNVGAFTFVISPTITLTGQVGTSSEGQLSLNNGSDHTQGLATLVATSAVGSIAPADVMGLTGQQATSGVGSITTNAEDLINISGVQATSAVGSIVPDGMALGITGVQATSAVGAISPSDVMGLTGQEAVSSVGDIIVLGYQDVNIVGNTNYSDVDVVGETSYTDVTHVA